MAMRDGRPGPEEVRKRIQELRHEIEELRKVDQERRSIRTAAQPARSRVAGRGVVSIQDSIPGLENTRQEAQSLSAEFR